MPAGLQSRTCALTLAAAFVCELACSFGLGQESWAIGPMSPMPAAVRSGAVPRGVRKPASVTGRYKSVRREGASVRIRNTRAKKKAARKPAVPPKPPQELADNLSIHTIAPGVVHKVHRGALFINVLDIDLAKADVQVKPVLASETFNRLDEVKDLARKAGAMAAVNANYFKHDGTPLGTLVVDGEWVAGPLMDRTSLGLTARGAILVDRVNLHGTLETSNPEVSEIWVNNINQPRRHGSRLIAYTRRWGSSVRMAYAGTLIAVDASGRVVDKTTTVIGIPLGGIVLSDSKKSAIARLERGDLINLRWQTNPACWGDVVDAVSGGPVLIRDGKLFVGLKDEGFRKSWTGSQIHARTAVGVTANRHLLLATIEGPHTLWDVAKFLRKLGAVDAMNLDGGGSTTMVVEGATVTRNKSTYQRRVASSLAVIPRARLPVAHRAPAAFYVPGEDLVDFSYQPAAVSSAACGIEMSRQDEAAGSSQSDGQLFTAAGPALPESEPVAEQLSETGNGSKLGGEVDNKQARRPKGSKYLRWMRRLLP